MLRICIRLYKSHVKHFRACNCFSSPLLLQTIIRKQGNNIFQVWLLCLFFWRELFAPSHLKLLLSYFPFPKFVLSAENPPCFSDNLSLGLFFSPIFHFKLNEKILMIFVNRKWVTAIQRGCWTSLCSRPPCWVINWNGDGPSPMRAITPKMAPIISYVETWCSHLLLPFELTNDRPQKVLGLKEFEWNPVCRGHGSVWCNVDISLQSVKVSGCWEKIKRQDRSGQLIAGGNGKSAQWLTFMIQSHRNPSTEWISLPGNKVHRLWRHLE